VVTVKRRPVGRGGHDLGATETVGVYNDSSEAADAIRTMIRQYDVYGPTDDRDEDPGNEGNYWWGRGKLEFVVIRFWIEKDEPPFGARSSRAAHAARLPLLARKDAELRTPKKSCLCPSPTHASRKPGRKTGVPNWPGGDGRRCG